MKYAAFLRGINVGGRVLVKMTDLKKLLEGLGFKDVVTVLASGNAVFESDKGTHETLTHKIEAALKKKYKRDISVMLRTIPELRAIEKSQPFKGVTVNPTTRLYVTFMYEPSRGAHIPKENLGFEILRIRGMEAFSVLELSPDIDTSKSMNALGKVFGPKMTMRNWNTVLKVIKAAE